MDGNAEDEIEAARDSLTEDMFPVYGGPADGQRMLPKPCSAFIHWLDVPIQEPKEDEEFVPVRIEGHVYELHHSTLPDGTQGSIWIYMGRLTR